MRQFFQNNNILTFQHFGELMEPRNKFNIFNVPLTVNIAGAEIEISFQRCRSYYITGIIEISQITVSCLQPTSYIYGSSIFSALLHLSLLSFSSFDIIFTCIGNGSEHSVYVWKESRAHVILKKQY